MRDLLEFIYSVTDNTSQNEFYLTSVIELLIKGGKRVDAFEASSPDVALGANDTCQLQRLNEIARKKVLDGLIENGVKIPFDEPKFRYANINDILLCIEGGSAGKKIGILEEKVCYGNKLCKFEVKDDVLPKFLYYYLQSPIFLKNFFDKISGIIGGVSISKIRTIEFEYPDVEEQKRIVEKIEAILPIIESINSMY